MYLQSDVFLLVVIIIAFGRNYTDKPQAHPLDKLTTGVSAETIWQCTSGVANLLQWTNCLLRLIHTRRRLQRRLILPTSLFGQFDDDGFSDLDRDDNSRFLSE